MSEALQISKALGGKASGDGNFLCRCPVPGHGKGQGDRSYSLSVKDGQSGIIVYCFAGCHPFDVLKVLRGRGLLDADLGGWPRGHCRSTPSVRPMPVIEPDAEAIELWRASVPVGSTLAERYLSRRCLGIIPPTIRFVPQAPYFGGRESYPALIVPIQAAAGRVIAAQATYLGPDGRKAASPARRTIGHMGTGAVRLGPVGPVLGLAEGVETALAAQIMSGVTCWACLGAARMHTVEIPDEVRELHIFADDDSAGRQAAERTADAHKRRRVVIHYPETGVGDFNDALMVREKTKELICNPRAAA